MTDPIWHALSLEETETSLSSDLKNGLPEEEALKRLAANGPNEITEGAARGILAIAWEQVSSLLIVILLIAAGLAGFLGKIVDAIAILSIVILFVVLGVLQEYRAQKAIAALKQMAAPLVRVFRGGVLREISARDLVPGDLISLETGNIAPADCRVVDSVNLKMMEASLTGESEAVSKHTDSLTPDLGTGDRHNMIFMGSFVTYGRGLAMVTATAMKTELGKIADMIQAVKQDPTPLQKRLDRLGLNLAVLAVIVGLAVIAGGLLHPHAFDRDNISVLLLTGVSIAVAIVPEGLPAVLTFNLALGAQRMLRRHALVRKLPAVETLGSVTVICSDKTGTLTQNRMTVVNLELPDAGYPLHDMIHQTPEPTPDTRPAALPEDKNNIAALLAGSILCNDARIEENDRGFLHSVGDPTEGALLMAGVRFGFSKGRIKRALPRIAEAPFNSTRKRMSTAHKIHDAPALHPALQQWLENSVKAEALLFTKGALEELLSVCTHIDVNGEIEKLNEEWRLRLTQSANDMSAEGLRVLALAYKALDDLPDSGQPVYDLEQDLILIGMTGMIDPARSEVKDAVATCRKAGIRPVMITGDHAATAKVIAAQLDIYRAGDKVMTGDELRKTSLDELRMAVRDTSVFARVSPEDKLKIVEALQQNGEIVAMTGDGVNDAPALKRADIGVAMGSGTDVAREAADMVLVDDNFATLVAAVEEGRVVYDNICRFILFSVSGNIGKVLAVAIPPFLGWPLLLQPIQILWSNLLTDGLLGLGMGMEKAERGTMRRPPISQSTGIFSGGKAFHVAWIGALIALIVCSLSYAVWQSTSNVRLMGTMAFTTLAFIQLGRATAARSFTDSAFAMNPFSNRVLFFMILAAFILQISVLYVPGLQSFFYTLTLAPKQILLCAGLAFIVFGAMEIEKAFLRKYSGRS